MGCLLLPMFAAFCFVAGGLGASLGVALVKQKGIAQTASGLAGAMLGAGLGLAAIVFGASGNASDGFTIFGYEMLGFLFWIGLAMFALMVLVIAGRGNKPTRSEE